MKTGCSSVLLQQPLAYFSDSQCFSVRVPGAQALPQALGYINSRAYLATIVNLVCAVRVDPSHTGQMV